MLSVTSFCLKSVLRKRRNLYDYTKHSKTGFGGHHANSNRPQFAVGTTETRVCKATEKPRSLSLEWYNHPCEIQPQGTYIRRMLAIHDGVNRHPRQHFEILL